VDRSLNVGEIIGRTFNIYVEQASVLLPAAAVVFVLSGILTALLIVVSPALVLIAVVIAFAAVTLFTGMIVELVADVQDGRRDATVGQLLGAVTPVFGKLILIGVVAGIGIAIGFVLIIVPGLILITIWSVAAPVVVLERPPGLGALKRSRELVQGHGWEVFGVIVILVIGVGILAAVIEAIGDSAGTGVGIVVRVLVQILTAPLSALAASVLYFELRDASAGAPVQAAPPQQAPPPQDAPPPPA
jgi:hypothetical protein